LRTNTLLIVFCALFLPAMIIYKKRAIPYFIALVQHSLFGNYFTGEGVQILWPMTTNWYGAGIKITSLTNVSLEWTFFLTCLTIMLKTKDAWTLFQHHPSNLLLSVPVLTVLLPTFFHFPLSVPFKLIILTHLTLFTLSILIDFKAILIRT